jgi:hypothetical protein
LEHNNSEIALFSTFRGSHICKCDVDVVFRRLMGNVWSVDAEEGGRCGECGSYLDGEVLQLLRAL